MEICTDVWEKESIVKEKKQEKKSLWNYRKGYTVNKDQLWGIRGVGNILNKYKWNIIFCLLSYWVDNNMNSEGRIALIINLISFPMVSLITHIRHNVLVSINMDGEHKSGHSFKGGANSHTESQHPTFGSQQNTFLFI